MNVLLGLVIATIAFFNPISGSSQLTKPLQMIVDGGSGGGSATGENFLHCRFWC